MRDPEAGAGPDDADGAFSSEWSLGTGQMQELIAGRARDGVGDRAEVPPDLVRRARALDRAAPRLRAAARLLGHPPHEHADDAADLLQVLMSARKHILVAVYIAVLAAPVAAKLGGVR